jgi:hypothetical protein
MGQSQGCMGIEGAVHTLLGDHNVNDWPPHGNIFALVLRYVAPG